MKGKFCINRAKTYEHMFTSGMILFIFLSTLKKSGYIDIEIEKYFFVIYFIGFLGLFILGWMDIYLIKAIQDERTFGFYMSPPFVEMKKRIDDLWKAIVGFGKYLLYHRGFTKGSLWLSKEY